MHVLKPLDPGVVTRPPTDVAPKAIISHALQGVANRPRLLPPVGFRDAWQMAAPSASRGVLQPMLEAQRQHYAEQRRLRESPAVPEPASDIERKTVQRSGEFREFDVQPRHVRFNEASIETTRQEMRQYREQVQPPPTKKSLIGTLLDLLSRWLGR